MIRRESIKPVLNHVQIKRGKVKGAEIDQPARRGAELKALIVLKHSPLKFPQAVQDITLQLRQLIELDAVIARIKIGSIAEQIADGVGEFAVSEERRVGKEWRS